MHKILSGDMEGHPSRTYPKHAAFILDMNVDLKLMLCLTISALVSAYLPFIRGTALQPVLSIAMVVLVPGYSLIAALFPGRAEIDALERLVLSLGLSMIIASLTGLVLNFTAWGIRLYPVVVALSALSAIFTLIASWRRYDLPVEDRFTVDAAKICKAQISKAFSGNATPLDNALTVILISSIVLAIGTTAYVIVFPQQGEQFTELYVLGPDGKAVNYSTDYNIGDNYTLIVGIANHEQRNVTYTLRAVLSGSGLDSELYTDVVTLADNQTVEKPVSLKPDLALMNIKLQFLLFRDGDTTVPYRECHLWLNVITPQ